MADFDGETWQPRDVPRAVEVEEVVELPSGVLPRRFHLEELGRLETGRGRRALDVKGEAAGRTRGVLFQPGLQTRAAEEKGGA